MNEFELINVCVMRLIFSFVLTGDFQSFFKVCAEMKNTFVTLISS